MTVCETIRQTARKTILVPWTHLAEVGKQHFLEIVIEPAGCGVDADSQFRYLNIHGLRPAVRSAQSALQHTGFRIMRCRSQPILYPVNPPLNASNASGAALGVALGLLMYHRRLSGNRLLASGDFIRKQNRIRIRPAKMLHGQLNAAAKLGLQNKPLQYYVPAQTVDGAATCNAYAESIRALARLNIFVRPVHDLGDLLSRHNDHSQQGYVQ